MEEGGGGDREQRPRGGKEERTRVDGGRGLWRGGGDRKGPRASVTFRGYPTRADEFDSMRVGARG